MRHSLSLTPATATDAEYLYDLIEATMRGYVEATFGDWNEEAMRINIAELLDKGQPSLLWLNGAKVGAMSVQEEPTEIYLHRLYIAPTSQGQGIGTQLLQELIQRARSAGKPLRLRVLAVNPAKRLYERLGFVVTETTPERYYMERAVDS